MSRTAGIVLVTCVPVLALLLHHYVACVAVVQSESMEPTMSRGDRLMVSRVAYLRARPREGDVVVLLSPGPAGAVPHDGGRWLVKRVAALEGAVVPGGDRAGITVPAGFLYVIGDNKAVSWDSRQFGPVPRRQVVGKAVLAYGRRGRVRRL